MQTGLTLPPGCFGHANLHVFSHLHHAMLPVHSRRRHGRSERAARGGEELWAASSALRRYNLPTAQVPLIAIGTLMPWRSGTLLTWLHRC